MKYVLTLVCFPLNYFRNYNLSEFSILPTPTPPKFSKLLIHVLVRNILCRTC